MYFSLALIVLLTVFLRLLPGRFGFYISEFDPYLQFYATKVIVNGVKEHGLSGLFDFFTHHIDITWQPEGVDLGVRYYPGVPYVGAIVYLILNGLGIHVSVEDVAIFLPVLLAVVSVLGVYFIGKELKGEIVGLLSALLLTISPAFIPRSNMGWYDTESLGMPMFILSILFYLKATRGEDIKKKVIYAFISGLTAGIMGGTWGAFSYLVVLYGALPLIAVLVSNLPDDYEIVHIVTTITFLMIINVVPRNGLTYLSGALAILIYISIAIVLINKIINIRELLSAYRIITGGLLLVLLVVLIVNLLPLGVSNRYLSVINPFYKSEAVFVTTVQEQAGVNVGAFLQNFNILIPFIIFGIYLLALKGNDISNLLIITLALSTIYASSNFARLFILAAPIMTIVSSYAIDSIVEKLFEHGSSQGKYKKFGKSKGTRVYAFTTIIILTLLISFFSYTFGMSAASIPPTVAAGGTPYRFQVNDWFEALAWIKDNVPNDSVIAAWWDYGYWISFIAGKKSLADNGTLNQSRIRLLAEMFLSNESRALEILDQLGADYILIFLGVMKIEQGDIVNYQFTGVGEDTKFIQMVRIAGLPTDMFVNDMETRINQSAPYYKDAFWNTFLGKLIPYEYLTTQVTPAGQPIDLYRFSPKYPMEPDGTSRLVLVFRSGDEFWRSQRDIIYYKPGEVLIYKIVRDSSS